MGKLVPMIILGVILVILGAANIKGNINSIHWYNRRRVAECDIPRYGRCMGTGTLIIGGCLIVSALVEAVLQSELSDYIIISGCAVGLAVMLYGQLKYNKGIF